VSYIPNPWESGNQAAEKRLGPVAELHNKSL